MIKEVSEIQNWLIKTLRQQAPALTLDQVFVAKPAEAFHTGEIGRAEKVVPTKKIGQSRANI